MINYPIVSPFASKWHVGETGGEGGEEGGSQGGEGGSNGVRSNACVAVSGAELGAELAVAAHSILLSHTGAMYDVP